MEPVSDERLASERRNRWAIGLLGGIAGFALCAIGVYFFFHHGVTVAVYNADPMTLSDCVVYTTGYSYPVGDIRPGQTVRIGVSTKGESHVEIEFRDLDGSRRRIVADCYFEGGYSGTLAVTLNREKVISTIGDLQVW